MEGYPNAKKYDCIAVGSGEAAKLVTWMLSGKQGQTCAVIERKWMGGSCPNIACLPSKTFIHSAAIAHQARNGQHHGVISAGTRIDMATVQSRKQAMLKSVNGFRDLFDAYKVDLIKGDAKFVAPKVVQLEDGRQLTADNIIVCTGSRAHIDASIPGLVEASPMTHIELLDIEQLPQHVIVIGGGFVGLEFAQALRRFGSEVTVIHRQSEVLPSEDHDAVEVIHASLVREGVRILTDTDTVSVHGTSGDKVVVNLRSTNGSDLGSVTGSHLLVATGRTPNTNDMGLELAGIATTAAGHIIVDEQLKTSVPGIYAAGDCANSPHFTHIGWDDFRVIYGSITESPRLSGTKGRLVPRALFTTPELARVGLSEKEAKAAGIPYRLTKLPMGMFLRTQTLNPGDTEGFAKALVEESGERILGFTAVGPGVSELLAVVTLAMKLEVSYREIENLIVAHPTLNEGLVLMFAETPAKR